MFFAPVFLAAALTATPAGWAKITAPAGDAPSPVGEYGNGCIFGAVSADLNHPYYQVIRQQNRRYYGHPELVDFIGGLAGRAHEAGLPILLIGDMAMPRGGRFVSGHASHQTGLDADVWFRMVKKKLSDKELRKPWALTIVRDNLRDVNGYYGKDIYKLVKLAAEDDRVERIFVNAAIKNRLCEDTPEAERGWLGKVRPWWGHTAHMHVRLACPEGAADCVKQAPPPKGTGCGLEVKSWLGDLLRPKKKEKTPAKPPRPVKKVPPALCTELIRMK